MENFYETLYIIFDGVLIVWIFFDIINVIIKKKTYNCLEAEVYEHVYVSRQSADDSTTYQIKLKYVFNGTENFYTTKYSMNFLLPKVGEKRKIYINPKNSSKKFFIELKIFISFILFRLVFIIPLIGKLLKNS